MRTIKGAREKAKFGQGEALPPDRLTTPTGSCDGVGLSWAQVRRLEDRRNRLTYINALANRAIEADMVIPVEGTKPWQCELRSTALAVPAALRAAHETKREDVEVVAINDLGPVATNGHLLKYDSVHGRFPGEVATGDNWMDIGRGKIAVTAERDPAQLPWRNLGVDVVLECTGIFTKRAAAAKHLEAGAKRVIVSAPADGADMTIVMGVNHQELTPEHKVISASCTTNCLAPVAYVLQQGIGIERGYMTTIHAYTGDQNIVDALHKDLRARVPRRYR